MTKYGKVCHGCAASSGVRFHESSAFGRIPELSIEGHTPRTCGASTGVEKRDGGSKSQGLGVDTNLYPNACSSR